MKWMRWSGLAAFLFTGVVIAAENPTTPPATRPATQPATQPRVLIKIARPPEAGQTEPLVALVDVNDVPDTKEWAIKAANYALDWYPKISKQLASEGFNPPRQFTLYFKIMEGVAYTSNTRITISAAWIRKHPEDMGMVAHELTHVIQHYRGRGNPGWLVEGVADYVRYYIVEPNSRQARFNPSRGYKGGYQPAAGLLNWLEKNHSGIVSQLNAMMRQGTYTDEKFKDLAGGTADEVWEQFKQSLEAAPKN